MAVTVWHISCTATVLPDHRFSLFLFKKKKSQLILATCHKVKSSTQSSSFPATLLTRACWQPPLCIRSVCCHSSPRDLPCQSVWRWRRVNRRCPLSREGLRVFICCHGTVMASWMDLAWQGVSSFIFRRIISSPACLCGQCLTTWWADKREAKSAREREEGESRDVQIVRLYWEQREGDAALGHVHHDSN